ncbi:baculoviral IAP repeat-containing protein 6-like [Euwallacea similis]|uniref:baculoviral IAP repeat-containing protein 6-like n=1 Tax=Euwallacea similis TaxID=1736056 RepID=UPI0034503E03
MAQDVFSKMPEEPWLLNEDGYLKVDTDVKKIIYHPSLNVILISTNNGLVRVLDVNSGVILQSTDLSAKNGSEVKCKYIPIEDRVLFCDGQAIGVRTDYNGVLLLDSALQKILTDSKENVKIELLLSEAVILKQSLSNAAVANGEQIINELQNVIAAAQQSHKKGIKAQKWNTACVTLPVGDIKSITSSIVSDFVTKKIHNPELQVASAVKERISELLGDPTNATDRKMMASEVRRRETFSQWPHMDYKWALPEQMAQAGFYHQPNASGDDRAMCFTCTVCLVSWERTDEPWSEHERHSPSCPFVIGEYTQNVPISVTNATAPAIDATFRGSNITILGTSSIPKLLPTSTSDGLVSVFDVSGKIKRTHSFFVTQFDSHILERFTQDFGVPGFWNDEKKSSVDKKVTALSVVSDKSGKDKPGSKLVRPTIVCGITIGQSSDNVINVGIEPSSPPSENFASSIVGSGTENLNHNKRAYLVVYDFMYNKEQEKSFQDKSHDSKKSELDFDNQFVEDPMIYDQLTNIIDMVQPDEVSNSEEYSLLKELTSFYKTLIPALIDIVEKWLLLLYRLSVFETQPWRSRLAKISNIQFLPRVLRNNKIKNNVIVQREITVPFLLFISRLKETLSNRRILNLKLKGESDSVFLPPAVPLPVNNITKKPHSGPRLVAVDVHTSEADSSSASDILGYLPNGPFITEPNESSISDHIVDLKKNQSNKKLNYSRAVQCIPLPDECKPYTDLEVTSILSTQDENHVLVTFRLLE